METSVIALDHPAAFEPAWVGRKAAALAKARAAGLPVRPGVVLTTTWSPEQRGVAMEVWRILSHDGELPLVVRASATGPVDDRSPATSAIRPLRLARELPEFWDAIDVVAPGPSVAVLVQPYVESTWRGVLYSDDAPTGRRRRPLVAAFADRGTDAWVAELDHRGRPRDVFSGPRLGHHPPAEVRARLIRLAEHVDDAFAGPNDIEWAAGVDGRVHLLSVRSAVRMWGALDTTSERFAAA